MRQCLLLLLRSPLWSSLYYHVRPADAEAGDSVLEQEPEDGRLLYDETDPIPMASGANLGRAGNLRPPAVVTEFMSQGSVKQALARKSDVVSGNMHRLVVAMDAAKVTFFSLSDL